MSASVRIYGVTLAAITVALVARWLLDPLLGDHLPYPTFFVAVIVAAWLGGLRPAMLATGLGFVLALYFFVPPRYSFVGTSGPHFVGLAMYFVVSLAIAGFGEAMQVARRRFAELVRQQEESVPPTSGSIESIRRKHSLRDVAVIGFGLTLAVLLIGGVLGFTNARRLDDNSRWVAHTHEVIGALETLMSTLKDAETGQRGYLLAEDETYLEPYESAMGRVQVQLARLKVLTSDNADQQARLAVLGPKIDVRLGELKLLVALTKKGDRPAALRFLRSGTGKAHMDELRQDIAAMQQAEHALLRQRANESEASYHATVLSILLTAIVGLVLVVLVFSLSQRNVRQRHRAAEVLAEQKERLRVTLASIGDAVVTTDPAGNVTYLNAVAQDLTGWTQDDAKGKPLTTVFNIINEQTRQPVENPVEKVLKLGQVVGLANHTVLIKRDGTERTIDDSAAPIRDDKGRVAGVVLVFRDITERRRAERAEAERTRLTALRADINTAIATTEETQAALQRCTESLVQHLDMAFARIWTLNEADNVLELQASAGQYTHLDGPHCRVKVGEFKIGRIASSRQPHLTNDVPDDTNVSDQEWAKREGMVAFAGYPLLMNGRVLGVVAMFARRPLTNTVLADLAPLAGSMGQYLHHRRTAAALLESEARKSAVVSCSLDGIITIDHEGTIIEFNPAAERTFGFRREDVLGREMAELIIPPPMRESHRRGIVHYLATGEGPVLGKRLEMTAVRSDGTEFPVEVAITRINKDGPPLFSGYIRDITDRKQAEERLREAEEKFRTLADNIPQLAWIADAGTDGQVHWFNRNWLDFTGATLEEMRGSGWQTVHHPDHAERVINKFAHHVQEGLDWEDTFPLRRKDGQFRWFLSRMKVIRNEAGAVVRIFGTNTDITEQMQRAEDLRKLTAELSEADRRKDEFLATLAHELRNPLAPIRNGLQVMRLASGNAAVVEQARTMMERQLGQMVHLVDDLLDVSRISRGKLELRKERVKLAAVLNSAVETSRPVIEASNHEITVSVPPKPIFVDADVTRLGQVFANLLNNAAKYSERGGRIWLTAERQGSDVVVSVKDTGVGIPPDMLPKIFVMFTQVDRSLERSQGGLGIGLTLVKRLVEMHGGSVEARSEGHGKGSEFIVRLPVVLSGVKEVKSPTEAGEPACPSGHCRILVADDNEDSATSLAMMLQIMGNEVCTANDGLQAVEVAAAFQPDVILLDIGMPKLNGYEACRRIREEPWGKKAVLIALTGWGQEEDKRRSQEAGFDHHMVKPVDPATLEKLLASFQSATG